MKKTILTALTALALFSGSAFAKDGKVKVGETTSVSGFWCLSVSDWKDVADYARSHDGDGQTAAMKKKAEGKCGPAVFPAAKVVKVLGDLAWKDKDAGDVEIVQMQVTMPDGTTKDIYGIFGPEQIDDGVGV